jgi:hypothetical protein
LTQSAVEASVAKDGAFFRGRGQCSRASDYQGPANRPYRLVSLKPRKRSLPKVSRIRFESSTKREVLLLLMGAIVFQQSPLRSPSRQMIHHNPEDCGGQRRQQHGYDRKYHRLSPRHLLGFPYSASDSMIIRNASAQHPRFRQRASRRRCGRAPTLRAPTGSAGEPDVAPRRWRRMFQDFRREED